MSQFKEIEFLFDEETGEVTIDNKHFRGKECEEINDHLTNALSGQTLKVKAKPEKSQRVQRVSRTQAKQRA